MNTRPAHRDLAIVIVTYNSVDEIADLLDSLPAALDGLTADVVVVDKNKQVHVTGGELQTRVVPLF